MHTIVYDKVQNIHAFSNTFVCACSTLLPPPRPQLSL